MVTTSHHGTLVTPKFCVCVQKCNMIRCSTSRPTVAQTSNDMVFLNYGKCRVEHCLHPSGMLPNISENTCQPTCVSMIFGHRTIFRDLQTILYKQHILKHVIAKRKYRARLTKHDCVSDLVQREVGSLIEYWMLIAFHSRRCFLSCSAFR